jgi:hypothetical protein
MMSAYNPMHRAATTPMLDTAILQAFFELIVDVSLCFT